MKRLYFLLSIIVMFSLDIFSSEKSHTSLKRERSEEDEGLINNKRPKFEAASILTPEESEQFTEDFKSGVFEVCLRERLKELEDLPGGLTPKQREEVESLKDTLELLSHNIEIERKEEEINFVLY
jgi:hypothetical protein